jgi:hypothetical protein
VCPWMVSVLARVHGDRPCPQEGQCGKFELLIRIGQADTPRLELQKGDP